MSHPTTAYAEQVTLPAGPRLAVRRIPGRRRPFLLVHGLASNARTWDGVARRLGRSGHEVVAVDQRGHGRSEQVAGGYTTAQCAADLARLVGVLGWREQRAPVLVGQSWGGNVVLELAAAHAGVAAGLALVDGGWIRLAGRFASFDECWAALAPPRFEGRCAEELARLLTTEHPDWSAEALAGTLASLETLEDGTVRPWLRRANHREILRSLYDGDPRTRYPCVDVPVLLAPALSDDRCTPEEPSDDPTGLAVAEAADLLPDAVVRRYVGADHDIHAQQPESLALDLRRLVARVEERSGP